jgi:hypothetical protein
MENIVEKVRERLPQEIVMKLNCTCYGAPWYETSYYPFKVLVKTICDVFNEERLFHPYTDFYDCVEVVNEITGLGFVADEDDENWDDRDLELEYLFDSEWFC